MKVKKKILVICNSFYPEISPRSFRATELVKEFARQNYDITVLTRERNYSDYNGLEYLDEIKIKSYGKLIFPKIKISKKKYLHLLSRAIARILSILLEYPSIEIMYRLKNILRKENDYDLLITIALPYPIHWGTAWARNKKNQIAKTWVADCGDPYMGNNIDTFKKPFYFKYLEKWFCRKADFISVPFEGAINGYYKEFRYKIKVIPQGIKLEEFKDLKNNYKRNSKPTFAYAGGFIPKYRDPRKLLDYLISLNVDYRFIIYTKSKNFIEKYIKLSKNRIEIKDVISRIELLNKLSKMDFLINIENETSIAMPSKLIDYSLTGRPILNLSSTDFKTEYVNEFLKGDYSNRFMIGDLDIYKIENVCKQFIDL